MNKYAIDEARKNRKKRPRLPNQSLKGVVVIPKPFFEDCCGRLPEPPGKPAEVRNASAREGADAGMLPYPATLQAQFVQNAGHATSPQLSIPRIALARHLR